MLQFIAKLRQRQAVLDMKHTVQLKETCSDEMDYNTIIVHRVGLVRCFI